MRAFLSHSSVNKDIVHEVFRWLGQANAEYDSNTFENGSYNTEAIRSALDRSDIFVLFATPQSLKSGFVEYEINVANERVAQKKIKKIITFCLDGVSVEDLPPSLKLISAVRKVSSVGAIVRSIKAELIELQIADSGTFRPFIGRDVLIKGIKEALSRPDEVTPTAIVFSGVDGIGRRTLASHVMADVYYGTGRINPTIFIKENFDSRDIYRELLSIIGGIRKEEIFEKIERFEELDEATRCREIAEILISRARENEITFFVDVGGCLRDNGRFSSDIQRIFEILNKENGVIPYIVFILFRTPPVAAREKKGVYYFRVDALESADISQLISLHIKRKGDLASADDVNRLVEITDGHPYNLQFLLRLLDTHSINTLIQDPSDIIIFKKRQGDDFLSRLDLKPSHEAVLGILNALGQSSVELIAAAVELSAEELGRALRELEEYNCIDRIGDLCSINRPLRSAFERSSRFGVKSEDLSKIQEKVLSIFNDYKDDDQINISIVSSAARAAIYLNKDSNLFGAFISPSNSLFVARQLYDLRKFSQCARACEAPLRTARFVSESARNEAVRLRCLSLARLGDERAFEATIGNLSQNTTSEKALRLFLEGFRHRLAGNPSEAAEKLKQSVALKPDSFATLRELSQSLSQLGEFEEAQRYAKEALSIAPTNPYIIDQALSLWVNEKKRLTRDTLLDPYVSDLLDRLERYGDENGKSFYAIRMSDIYRRIGDKQQALDYAKRACHLTSSLVSAHIVEAEALIKLGRMLQASAKIDGIRAMVDDKSSGEGKLYLPEYIMLKINYLIETGKYEDAIALTRSQDRKIKQRVVDVKRRIASAVLGGVMLSNEANQWLKGSS